MQQNQNRRDKQTLGRPLCSLTGICLFFQTKNGRRKRCWCVLVGKMFIYYRSPADQVMTNFKINYVKMFRHINIYYIQTKTLRLLLIFDFCLLSFLHFIKYIEISVCLIIFILMQGSIPFQLLLLYFLYLHDYFVCFNKIFVYLFARARVCVCLQTPLGQINLRDARIEEIDRSCETDSDSDVVSHSADYTLAIWPPNDSPTYLLIPVKQKKVWR